MPRLEAGILCPDDKLSSSWNFRSTPQLLHEIENRVKSDIGQLHLEGYHYTGMILNLSVPKTEKLVASAKEVTRAAQYTGDDFNSRSDTR